MVLSGAVEPDDDTLSVQLLSDVHAVFEEQAADRLSTHSLLDALRSNEESPWSEYGRDGLKPHGLARLLRPYAIAPRLMKIGGIAARGYDREQFGDAFARYLPSPVQGRSDRYSVTSEHESEREGNGVTDQPPVTEEAVQPIALRSNGKQLGWDGIVRSSCARCQQLADDPELIVVSGRRLHRDPSHCQLVSVPA